MVSLLTSLNMTANALSVNEKAISVVSHNVSNMNTEGYHKQRANLVTRNIAGMIGDNVYNQIRSNGGVKIANVMRYNDEYLNNYYRTQLSDLGKLEQQLDGLGDLAAVLDDLDGKGIDGALSAFYKALNNLNEYPASSTARINFIETSKTLTSILNTKYAQLEENTSKALGDGKSDESLKNSKIYVQYRELNNKLDELAKVNKALQTTQTGSLEANNLLDKRDLILNDIAKFTDITVEEKHNGSVNVYVGNIALVKGAEVKCELKLQTAKYYCENQNPPIVYPNDWDGENAVVSFVDPNDENNVICPNANSLITSGVLGGLLHFATDNGNGEDGINAGTVMNGLNQLASTLAEVFNYLNQREGAYCIDPNDTGKLVDATLNPTDIFQSKNGEPINAGNICINSELLSDKGCWKLSCAYIAEGENFDPNAVGNSQNVASMLMTRDNKIYKDVLGDYFFGDSALNINNTSKELLLDGMAIEDYYTSLVGKVASAGSNIQSLYDTQSDVIEAIESKIKDATGVDLNEELVDLVKYQTAYSAAAQVFNTCNNCISILMSLGG